MQKLRNYLQKVEVIYTDVDGTFVSDGSLFKNSTGYSLKNAAAIVRLLTAGVDVVMISGREKEKLKETARILGLQNYIGNLGIEIVYNLGEKVITNLGTDVPGPAALKKWIADTGVVDAIFERYPEKSRYYLPWSDDLRSHHLLIGELAYPETAWWIERNFPAIRLIDNGAVPPAFGFSAPHAYHIVPRSVGKKQAVHIDKKERHLPRENLIAIGDSMEDVTVAEEVSIFFLLDDTVETTQSNVIRIDNSDGEGFSRIVHLLAAENLI